MKKIFLSLLTIFMVLSLSVVLVKASESTTVSLEDGVQIRTDGNNGLKWVANVANHKEGNEYGFLFAQGDLAEVTIETNGVVNKVVEGVTDEELTMAATMVNFPKSAATQDISVVAYVLADDVYTYSNVVVRNLSEVAVNAYEKGIATGDFVEAVYDASETTFNLNGGEFFYPYEFTISRYDYSCWTDSNYQVGMNSAGKTSSSGLSWYRLFLTETSKGSGIYQITASGYEVSPTDYTYDYMIGAYADSTYDVQSTETVVDMVKDKDITNYYVKFLDEIPDPSNECSIRAIAHTDPEILIGESSHIGGGETLPITSKDYYDFAGWCVNEDLSDTPTFKQGKDRTLYAKYTPTEYTITYELNGGSSSATLVTSYNIETATFALPTASEMTIIDGNFGGWYDNVSFNGDAITSISLGSYGNKTLYAKWIMNAPTEVELSEADATVFAQVTPTIVVCSTFTAGKYSLDGMIYEAGVSAVSSIASALSIAQENDIIYVFNGTYSEDLTIATSNLSIIGPNYNTNGNVTRSTEAIISGILTINASNIAFNGFKFTGSSYITLNASTNVSFLNIYSDATGHGYNKNNGNRKGFIYSAATVKNLVIKNSYFTVGSSLYCKDVITSYGTINGMTLEGNTFTHSYAGSTTTEMITATNIAGVITINNNYIEYPNGNFSIMLGAYSNSCTKIDVTNNTFGGGKYVVAGLYIRKAPATCTVNIIGNTIVSMTGNCMDFNGSVSGSVYNIKYNYFDANTSYKITNKGSATINYENNYYAATQTTTTSDYGVITSKDALDAAYAEYLSTLE